MRHTLLLLLLSAGMYAQVSHYSFTESTENYSLTEGTNSTAAGNTGVENDIPIGFTFNYSNVDYNTFSISTAGFIRLGYPIIDGAVARNNNLRGSQHTVLAPLWDYNHRGTGSINYTILGAAPNRVLEVAWDHINIAGGIVSTNTASFKIRLFETTNVIEFVYGNNLGTAGDLSASIGLSDEVSYLSVSPSTASTVSSTLVNNSINTTDNLTGKKFRFTPPAACSANPTVTTISPSMVPTCQGAIPKPVKAKVTSVGVSNLAFQWEQSTDQMFWNDVTGNVSAKTRYLTPPAYSGINTYYRLKVTCLTTGATAYSAIATVTDATVPSTQSSNVTVTQFNYSTVRISWKNGNGYNRFVYFSDTPDFQAPSVQFGVPQIPANNIYNGQGTQIVYNGTSSKVDVTGLQCNTLYYIKVYEFQQCGSGDNLDYYVNSIESNNTAQFTISDITVLSLPVQNNFSLFTGANMNTVYPGWYESSIVTVPGTEPSSVNPTTNVSTWRSSNVFGVPSVAVRMSSANANAWVISPKIDLTQNATLHFKVALTDYNTAAADPGIAGTDDKLKVMISTDGCGAQWEPLFVFSAENLELDYLSNVLSDFQMSLADYTGQTVQIAFQATDGPVDDVPIYDFHVADFSIIQNTTVGSEDFTKTQLTYYPNPVEDKLTINNTGAIQHVTVTNLLGQQVFYSIYESTEATVDFSSLTNGVYVVTVSSDDKLQTFKVIKK